MKRMFETYQPETIQPNNITVPNVFNGMCLIRRYRVTIEEIKETSDVLIKRLYDLYNKKQELGITHTDNIRAMRREAKNLGINLM